MLCFTCRISVRFFLWAISVAVSCCLFLTLGLHPDSRRTLVSFRRPMAAAMWSAVSPFLFCSEGLHLALTRIRITPAWP